MSPMSHIISSMVLVAALFTTASLSAADHAGHPSAGSATSPVLNTSCPMCGMDVDAAKSPTVPVTIGEGADAKHYRMAMCSDGCCATFKRDPAAALKPKFGKDAPGPKTNFK